MLSFKPINDENREEILADLINIVPDSDADYIAEIFDSLLDDDTSEYAVTASFGCLLVRVFDDGYSFIYPIDVCETADPISAVSAIREYSVKEEIPLVFCDLPADSIGTILPLFRHASLDAQDPDGENYTLRIISEAAAISDIPTIEVDDEIVLDEMTENDDSLYARLCRDRETNKFWGYDDLADCDSSDDSYFRLVAEGEFSRGVAISFAIRYKGSFVGEATLYGFDLLGGCQCALRILPEMRRCAIASRSLSALISFGSRIGLLSVSATVMAENEASVALCKNRFDEYTTSDGLCTFTTIFDN